MACRTKLRPNYKHYDVNPDVLTLLAWADREIVFGLENGTVAQGTLFERTLKGLRGLKGPNKDLLDSGHWGFSSAANPEDRSMTLTIHIAGGYTRFYCGEAGSPIPPEQQFWEALFYHSG